MQPTSINGWFWTAELQKLAATTDRRQNDWSENGGIGQPQPDNRELQQGGGNRSNIFMTYEYANHFFFFIAPENCLAILNNFYNDGVHWHDVGKLRKKLCFRFDMHLLIFYYFLFILACHHVKVSQDNVPVDVT